jgi:NADH-quinone oxidoreductase subunit N
MRRGKQRCGGTRSLVDFRLAGAGYAWLAVVGVVASVVSVGYYLHAAYAAYTGEAPKTVRTIRGRWTAAGVVVAAFAVILLGVLPGPMTAWAMQVTAVFGGP